MKKVLGVLFVLGLISTSFGEMRTWTSTSGKTIVAEVISSRPNQVVLRDKKGKTYRLPPSKLSAADREYLMSAFPPKMEITFKKNQDRRGRNNNYNSILNLTGEVKIKKKSPEPYNKEMVLVFLMIGQSCQTGDLIILDRVEKTFDFNSSKEISVQGNLFRLYEDKYDHTVGVNYKGFFVAVVDEQGKIIAVKTSRRDFEKKSEFLVDCKKNERFTENFAKTGSTGQFIDGNIMYW